MGKRRVILTTFAGRRACMSVLLRYARALIARGLVHEFHAWNFTRDPQDERWLRQEFAGGLDGALLATPVYRYVKVRDMFLRRGGEILLEFRTRSDAHVMLRDLATARQACEIVLGGWNNTGCAVRRSRQGEAVASCQGSIRANQWNELVLRHGSLDGRLSVQLNGVQLFELELGDLQSGGLDVSVAGWDDSPCMWKVCSGLNERRERLFEVSDKATWAEYYQHYASPRYADNSDHLVFKCDDDIVFIDPSGFQHMVDALENDQLMGGGRHLMVFPSIVNNGVCAYHQQAAGLLPKLPSIGELPYDTKEGRLWGDGELCQRVHERFVATVEEWTDASASLPIIKVPIGDRVSINFFGIRSEYLRDVFGACGPDDEHDLTVTIPKALGRGHLLVQPAVVAHLAFWRQRVTGLDQGHLLGLYGDLASRWLQDGDTPVIACT